MTLPTPRLITRPSAEYGASTRRWQGIPGIERTASGRLWATWYTGGPGEGAGNHCVLATSDDDGITWVDPVLVIAAPDANHRTFDPGLWIDPLGRLWLFWNQSLGHYDGRAGVWVSVADDPDSPRWSTPRRIANGVMMNKPTVLRNGDWVFPTAVWSHLKADLHPELAGESRSNALVSTDAGQTFALRGGADVPGRTFDEHLFVELADGRLQVLVRLDQGIGQSFSSDAGRTWTPGERTSLPGPGSRFFVRRLSSGRLLLVSHQPDPRAPTVRSDLTAWLSSDDGQTWQGGLVLDERPGVSYPDGVQAADGRIYLIYDYNRGDMHARGADREILMAVISEADILSGRVGSAARLRQLVSRATGPKIEKHAKQ